MDLCSWPALGSNGQRNKKIPQEEEVPKEEAAQPCEPEKSRSRKPKKKSKDNQGKTTTLNISDILLIAASNKIQASKKKNEKRVKRIPKKPGLLHTDIVKKKGKVREVIKVKTTRIKRAITLGRLQRQTEQGKGRALTPEELEKIEEELKASKQALIQRVRKKHFAPEERPPPPEVESTAELAKASVHSRRFRPYCNNARSDEVREAAQKLVETLRGFQDKMYQVDPAKARLKKRFVCGFNEVRKFVKVGDAKLVLVAMDIECTLSDPIYCMITELKKTAAESHIPLIFAGSKRELGKWTRKRSGISALALMNLQGAEEPLRSLLSSWEAAKKEYEKMVQVAIETDREDGPVEEIQNKILGILCLPKSQENEIS